jgi:hypothetical protein
MKYPNFRRAIRSLFPPPRRFVQRLAETETTAGRGAVEWILARALVHYKLFSLAGVPKNQRVALLRMQIRQWTPYAAAGSCVVIEGDSAMVWLWNKARVDEAVTAAGLAPARIKVIPETLLEPQLNNGLRLLKTLDGIEAQVWKSNTLAASRWWPEVPPADEWLAFQRDAGLAEHAALPATAQVAPLLAEPWARAASLEDYRALDSRNERLIYAIGIVLLGAATFWYGSYAIKRNAAVNASKAELSTLNDKAQPVIAARNEAQVVLLRTQALLALDPYPDQLQLMARVGEILPKNGTYIREWAYQGGKLKLMLFVPDAGTSSSALVSSLQTAGPFNNVRAAAGGDSKTLIFNMDVNPRGYAAP